MYWLICFFCLVGYLAVGVWLCNQGKRMIGLARIEKLMNAEVPQDGDVWTRDLTVFETQVFHLLVSSGHLPKGLEVVEQKFVEDGVEFGSFIEIRTETSNSFVTAVLVGCNLAAVVYGKTSEILEVENQQLGAIHDHLENVASIRRAA